MKQTQRHNGIIELVKQQGYVSTEELVEHFSVSPQTIRRDLNELAEQNLILRHHGGAALPSSSVNTPWHDRKATQTEEKERIARKVAEQIPNGSTLFIDIGTTPEAVAHALLNHSNLRIVTNNLNVANTLMVKEDFRIILAGGELRSRDGGIIGEATARCWSSITTKFAPNAPLLRTRATLCWLSITRNLAVTRWSIWAASAW
ncbi:Glycerol-3-phosphate regulon repressor [Escherichia coli P12b]|nr:Glycerol-3-phosphate regulon repressor [Escherichia coli P12b]